MEGDEQQKRDRAREAREEGRWPSEDQVTSGASKQRHHLPEDEDHERKLETKRKGKQP